MAQILIVHKELACLGGRPIRRTQKPEIGSINWHDLTVPNADELQQFYTQVVGWKSTPYAMGDYDDFNIHAPDSDAVVAGICHARGANANIPPQWLIYITVADVDTSAATLLNWAVK